MPVDQIVTETFKYFGPSGVTIALLIFAVVKLFQRNEQLTDKYIALTDKISTVLEQNTASRNQMTAVFQQLKDSVDESVIVPNRRGRFNEPH